MCCFDVTIAFFFNNIEYIENVGDKSKINLFLACENRMARHIIYAAPFK